MLRRVTLVIQIRPIRLRTRPSVSDLTKVEPSGKTFRRVLFRENFQARMKVLADTIPNGNGHVLLLPALGHVPHLEAPNTVVPPLVAFLEEGVDGSQ